MNVEDERRLILDMVSSGQISAEEGVNLLNALQGEADSLEANFLEEGMVGDIQTGDEKALDLVFQDEDTAVGVNMDEPQVGERLVGDVLPQTVWVSEPAGSSEAGGSESSQGEEVFRKTPPSPGVEKWRRWRWIPIWTGVGITVIGSWLMFLAWQASAFSFWMVCASVPFILGVALLALAWGGRNLRWLHVRVHQAPGERPQKIAISLPLPVGVTAWALRNFGHRIHGLDAAGLDGLLHALSNTSPEEPFYVEVDEGENGERVEVFIG